MTYAGSSGGYPNIDSDRGPNLVERLRKPVVRGLTHPVDDERKEAADEIERRDAAWAAKVEEMHAEIKRLNKEIEILKTPHAKDHIIAGWITEGQKCWAEIERLHECLKERDNLCRKLEAAIARERERCARVAESHFQYAGKEIAAAIRGMKDE